MGCSSSAYLNSCTKLESSGAFHVFLRFSDPTSESEGREKECTYFHYAIPHAKAKHITEPTFERKRKKTSFLGFVYIFRIFALFLLSMTVLLNHLTE